MGGDKLCMDDWNTVTYKLDKERNTEPDLCSPCVSGVPTVREKVRENHISSKSGKSQEFQCWSEKSENLKSGNLSLVVTFYGYLESHKDKMVGERGLN